MKSQIPNSKLKKKPDQIVKKIKRKSALSAVIYDTDGKEVGTIELPKEIFAVKVSDKLLAQYARVYLANQRQGTLSTKTRGEVTGSTRKIYRQKGTGRARHGDIKAPIFVGGGIAHGPKPRDFSLTMTKQQRRKALLASLSLRFKQKDIFCVDGLLKIKPKTKEIIKILENLKLHTQKSLLFIYPKERSENFILAARNIPAVRFCGVSSINAYEILKPKKIIFAREALEKITN